VEGKESEWPGEAKIAGRATSTGAIESEDDAPAPQGEMFVADIHEIAVTGLNPEATKLVVEWWTPADGLQRIERD
jgi:hypothetical protein